MRTTVTLDPDTEQIIRQRMKERGQTFKQALNGAIRGSAIPAGQRGPLQLTTHDLGTPRIDTTEVLRLARLLEDEQILKSMDHEVTLSDAPGEDS